LLEQVLSNLDARTLGLVAQSCKAFRTYDPVTNLRFVDKVARDLVHVKCGTANPARWKNYNWLERLYIEGTITNFDRKRCEKQGFQFHDNKESSTVNIKLEGIGPKLLVSDVTTADVPLMRWRMELKGNNAMEFGVIPECLQEKGKSMHKCEECPCGDRSAGFASSITVGSTLPIKVPLMRGSVIEILAMKHRLEFMISNPQGGMEMVWHNTHTVPKAYKGPSEMHFDHPLQSTKPLKLAATCWARASVDVLHVPGPGKPQ